jgi:FkbM family methyltransferase
MALRLHTPGRLNRFGKKITPYFGRIASNPRTTAFLELTSAYLNCIIGKGGGSGWDPTEEQPAARMIRRENPVILDIGANRGRWTRELRHLIGERGRWILIDAASECCEWLRKLDNVEVIEAAVGERKGKTHFYTPGDGFGAASVHKRDDSYLREQGVVFAEREVDVVTIDDILGERGIETVDMVKMDIEGNELSALRGAEQSLKKQRIRALTFEFGCGNIASRTFFRDYYELLTGHGYQLHRIYPGGKTVPVREYYEDLEYFRGVTNYLATVEK